WHIMGSDGNCFDSSMLNYYTANSTLYSCASTPTTGCSSASTSETCGNGYCGSGETTSSCPSDCGSTGSTGTTGASPYCYDCSSCTANGCPSSHPEDSACAAFNASACGTVQGASTSRANLNPFRVFAPIKKLLGL
ncbi:MAG: hypothetical protein AAB671_00740, partial [Patescibacteria group bacterium]